MGQSRSSVGGHARHGSYALHYGPNPFLSQLSFATHPEGLHEVPTSTYQCLPPSCLPYVLTASTDRYRNACLQKQFRSGLDPSYSWATTFLPSALLFLSYKYRLWAGPLLVSRTRDSFLPGSPLPTAYSRSVLSADIRLLSASPPCSLSASKFYKRLLLNRILTKHRSNRHLTIGTPSLNLALLI